VTEEDPLRSFLEKKQGIKKKDLENEVDSSFLSWFFISFDTVIIVYESFIGTSGSVNLKVTT